jgi:hypothetical protein
MLAARRDERAEVSTALRLLAPAVRRFVEEDVAGGSAALRREDVAGGGR